VLADPGRGTSLILTLYAGFRKEMGGQQELDKNDLANFRPAEPRVKHVDHLDWVGASWIGPKAPRN
jgi:ABC-type thiamine transport system ATPase subunit